MRLALHLQVVGLLFTVQLNRNNLLGHYLVEDIGGRPLLGMELMVFPVSQYLEVAEVVVPWVVVLMMNGPDSRIKERQALYVPAPHPGQELCVPETVPGCLSHQAVLRDHELEAPVRPGPPVGVRMVAHT